jgi:hypothetical protein
MLFNRQPRTVMRDLVMNQIPAPSPTLREQVAAALVPFFMTGADGDTAAAQEAAAATLDDYAPKTPKELQLAAQIVAFSFATLACLGAAAMVRTQDLDVMLDLQDSALAMNALSDKSTKALEARRLERERAPQALSVANTQWDNTAFQKAIARALEKLLYANTRLAALHDMAAEAAPAAPEPEKLSVLSAEPMTLSLLARRDAEAAATLGLRAPRTRQ